MKNLSDLVRSQLDGSSELACFDWWLEQGVASVQKPDALHRKKTAVLKGIYADVRHAHGFGRVSADLLTKPSDNLKLDKGATPAYGITLQHYVQKMSTGLTVNACPWAGDCTKVCVLDNGSGRYDTVQRARRAKSEFLAYHAHAFAYLLGRELAQAVAKHGKINLRPNVNSDLEWECIAPLLCNGLIRGIEGKVTLYGYTKNPARVLHTDGWLGSHYRVAFSANENLGIDDVQVFDFLMQGGSVAVVTDRKPKTDVEQWSTMFEVVDADLTDEWMFEAGVIGDLSAKGKARRLIGTSGFVQSVSQRETAVLVGA